MERHRNALDLLVNDPTPRRVIITVSSILMTGIVVKQWSIDDVTRDVILAHIRAARIVQTVACVWGLVRECPAAD